MLCPKKSHQLALKMGYLKHIQDRGLLLDPNSDIFKVDAYPNYYFAGIYGHKNLDDPSCAKSCTGFIITFSDCPVFLDFLISH